MVPVKRRRYSQRMSMPWRSFISKSISKLILSVLQLVATAAILLWINVKIDLFILLLYPAVVFLTVKLGKSVKKLKGSENKAIAGFQKIANFLEAVHELRVSRRDKHFLTHIKSSAGTMRDAIISSQWKTNYGLSWQLCTFPCRF